jgi:hypothetical protein
MEERPGFKNFRNASLREPRPKLAGFCCAVLITSDTGNLAETWFSVVGLSGRSFIISHSTFLLGILLGSFVPSLTPQQRRRSISFSSPVQVSLIL